MWHNETLQENICEINTHQNAMKQHRDGESENKQIPEQALAGILEKIEFLDNCGSVPHKDIVLTLKHLDYHKMIYF